MVSRALDFVKIFHQACGQLISSEAATAWLNQVRVIECRVGQPFWGGGTESEGLYIVLAGRARMVSPAGNLMLSLPPGSICGEMSLFPSQAWQSYSVRASQSTILGFLDLEQSHLLLRSNYPQLRDYFYRQAISKDLFALFHHHPLIRNLPGVAFMEALLGVQHYTYNAGVSLQLSPNRTWFIRAGVLTQLSGQRLCGGGVYHAATEDQRWHVEQPVELYCLETDVLKAAEEAASSPVPQQQNAPINLTSSHPEIDDSQSSSPSPEGTSRRGISPLKKTPKQRSPAPSTKATPQKFFPSPILQGRHWWQRFTHRYPFVKQQSRADCGIACLIMVSRYWGKQLSTNHLRELAGVSRSGSTLRGLIQAAEGIGFAARPVKGTLQGLAQQPLPAILHWKGNHYVVVYAVNRKQVFIADPALGRRTLTYAELEAGWAGYTLLLRPTKLFQQNATAKQDLWHFVELVKPYKAVLLEVLLASLLLQLIGLGTPLLTQILLDRVIIERSISTFTAAASGVLIFSMFSILMSSLRRYLLFHTANRIDLSLAVGFIAHALRLPQQYFDARYVGDITSRVSENRTIRRFLSSEALLTSIDLMMVVIYFVLMFWYSWQLGMLALTLVPVLTFVTLVATPFLRRISREIFQTKTQQESYLIEALTGITTVKALGIERLVRWRWEDLFGAYIQTNLSGQIIRERLHVVTSLLKTIGMQLLFLGGIWLVIQGQLSIGQLIAFNMLLGNVFSPFERMIGLWDDFQEVLIAVERLNDVLDAQPEEASGATLPALPQIRGHIRFEQVTFRYNPDSDRNILENLNFEVLPGQSVAIVGRSGSGKTTLAKLLLGLYPVTQGRILIDGYDVSAVSKHSVRHQMGVVDQNTFLFGGTIRENIGVAYPNATIEQIQAVARLAGADEFIQDLPLKYETPIGEGGGLLSGGQRQRLAIARALLGNPRLLILDEATSNLDTESERMIQTHLKTILKHRTALIIAHRLSTVREADLILVLDRGILVERGTHHELMGQRGTYFYLSQQQLTIV
jgi:HlyB family type I secretion system ABC transporter